MKLITSILLFTVAITASAQSDTTKKCVMPMMVHSFGASYQQFSGLNNRVAGLPQFKQLNDYSATLGLGWLKERKNIITSGTLTLGSTMSGDHDEKSSTVHYYGINADLGYDVVKSQRVMLYPFVGLGLQGYRAIFYKDNSAVDFDDVLESNTLKNAISSVKFNNTFFVYRAGLGFSISSPKCPGSSIGLQAGYVGSFKSEAWKSNENQALGNAPKDKISQAFIGLTFISTPKFMNWK